MSLPRILVILDLDETLIHADPHPVQSGWAFAIGPYKVFTRPGLMTFLDILQQHFEVAVWSSASHDYVIGIVTRIFPREYPLQFVWSREKCVHAVPDHTREHYPDHSSHMYFVKPLQKVQKAGYGILERMLIIDDTPAKAKKNYGNAIYPRPFTGDPADNELARLLDYLMEIKDEPNMRKIEKRNWRKTPY